jgi:hypothetical protein
VVSVGSLARTSRRYCIRVLLRQAALVRQLSLARKWLLASASVAVIAVAGTVGAVAGAAGRPAARLHSVPPSIALAHYKPARFISAAVAERTALAVASAMGPGARVLQARLTSVSAASKATGHRVASYDTGDSREVWLVWLRGPFRMVSCITATACPLERNQVFYAAIDAKTGFDYGLGWSPSYQHRATP